MGRTMGYKQPYFRALKRYKDKAKTKLHIIYRFSSSFFVRNDIADGGSIYRLTDELLNGHKVYAVHEETSDECMAALV